jgi:hypothetical protein
MRLGFFIPHPDEAAPKQKDPQELTCPELTVDPMPHRATADALFCQSEFWGEHPQT